MALSEIWPPIQYLQYEPRSILSDAVSREGSLDAETQRFGPHSHVGRTLCVAALAALALLLAITLVERPFLCNALENDGG